MNRLAVFSLCCLALWLIPIYLPGAHLFFFVPFLALLVYQGSLQLALSMALGCGLIMDLLSGYMRLGIHSAAYVAAMAIVWWLCRWCFFHSQAATVFIAALLSFFTTGFLCVIGACMGESWYPQWSFWLYDLVLGSGVDALYTAFCLFLCRLPQMLSAQLAPQRR